jgi:hypothetical protein
MRATPANAGESLFFALWDPLLISRIKNQSQRTLPGGACTNQRLARTELVRKGAHQRNRNRHE